MSIYEGFDPSQVPEPFGDRQDPKHTDTSRSGDLVERLLEPADWAIERPLVELRNEAADRIEAQAREIGRLRGLIEWVKHCDGLGTFRKIDRREVIISFEDSGAGMTFFERMSDFIDEARAALARDSHDQ